MNQRIGIDNRFVPFKGRRIDLDKPVRVYRNLNSRDPRKRYSIWQDGLVRGHTHQLMLHNVHFLVSKAGQRRVLTSRRKNVHARAAGYISLRGGMGTCAADKTTRPMPARITYNPFKDKTFQHDLTGQNRDVVYAQCVIFNERGVWGAYLSP